MRLSILSLLPAAALAAPRCDLRDYRPQPDLVAESGNNGELRVTWQGERNQELRAVFVVNNAQPVIRSLAARAGAGNWSELATNLTPDFEITSGRRRISNQQLEPLRALGRPITPEVIEKEKWNAFWDAPLEIPGSPRTNPDLPRRPEEIRRGAATYSVTGCAVRTTGARLEVSFEGANAGVFSAGRVVYTVYKGTNLLRQELVAQTNEPSVAYKYRAGLRGFAVSDAARLQWLDTARAWQEYRFGGPPNSDPVVLRARNRLAVLDTGRGSIAVFPPPHKFFWAREIELNLGYVFYRRDSDGTFSLGVRQADREEMYRPYGVSDEVWNRRSRQSRNFAQGNFALYNAPPGTWQRMPVYFYITTEDPRTAHARVLAYTHNDTYKHLPGYQIAVSHFHTHFHEQLSDAGTLDLQPTWLPVFRALGINIAMMSDFHSDGHPKDSGPLRFKEQKTYFEGLRRHSDRDLLLMPGEEPNAWFGGHYTAVFPRPVYWTHDRAAGQPLIEDTAEYGRVYHVGSPEDELAMFEREGGLFWQSHPRTKGSTGYPDATRETKHFRSDRFLGGSFQSLPVDLSESRLCEKRCFDLLDDMNNWTSPKYLIAEGDTYMKYPDDETYPHLYVNYLRLDRLPEFDEDWSPILKTMRAGNYFVSSGEVLLRSWSVAGTGANREFLADLEWTFPLEFVEIVWGDGIKVGRKVIPATEQPAFGSRLYRVPFEAAGVKWVRFAAWDSAGNGAFTQPIHLK
ncbi:MAG TPA: hypothetical protein VFL57_04190 [Bryobacteraceae bacterium]|nr:hypothetical protein [Bryobacteraceae bacterium]